MDQGIGAGGDCGPLTARPIARGIVAQGLDRLRGRQIRSRLKNAGRRTLQLADRLSKPSRYVALPSFQLHAPHMSACTLNAAIYDAPPAHEAHYLQLHQAPLIEPPRTLFPPYRYARPEPRLWGAPAFLETLFAFNRRCQAAPDDAGAATVEGILRKAIIFRDAIYVAADDGVRVLYESVRAADRVEASLPTDFDLRSIRRLPSGADHVFLGCIGSSNYGHFLTDDLTRLSMPRSDGSTVMLLTDHGPLMNARREELLRLALSSHRFAVRFVDGRQPIEVEHLRYVSRATRHPGLKSPDAIAAMVERVMHGLGADSTPRGGGKLLIARTGAGTRGLINMAAIAALLADAGFAVLDPIAASATEQIRACAQASCIIGVMGAAMTNTVFARPGTTIVHLAPEGWLEPYYWDLAAVRGHDYRAIYGPSSGSEFPWRRAFTIDPALVMEAIA